MTTHHTHANPETSTSTSSTSSNGHNTDAHTPSTTVRTQTLAPGIVEVRLHRPARMNALAPPLMAELLATFRHLQHDRHTRVVILTGEGKGFCAGADLQEVVTPGGIPGTAGMGQLGFVYKYQEYLAELVLSIHECDKPVIAAINGAAVGGGLALALASDIRIASTHARFGAAFIKTGLSAADMGTSYFLPRLVGAGPAAELMLTGRIFDAAEAQSLRMVSQVVAPEALIDTALHTARAIAENAEYGVWMTKKTLNANIDAPSLRQAMELENRTQVLGTFTGCMEASMEAFAQGHAPRWRAL